jgi:hypothetical protein
MICNSKINHLKKREKSMTIGEELIRLFSEKEYRSCYAAAKSTHRCVLCGQPASLFRDASCRLEYDVSGLCQECQDSLFMGTAGRKKSE